MMLQIALFFGFCTVSIVLAKPPMKEDTEGYPFPEDRGTAGVRLYSGLFDDVIPNYSVLTFSNFSDDEKMGDANTVLEGIWCQNADSSAAGIWYTPYHTPVPVYSGDFGTVDDHMHGGPKQHRHMHTGPEKVKDPEMNYYSGNEPIFSAQFEGQTVLLRDRNSMAPSAEYVEGLYYCNIANQTLVVGLYTDRNDVRLDTTDIEINLNENGEAILTFNVSYGPPTFINCTGPGGLRVDESNKEVKREIIVGETTGVTISLKERLEGTIMCHVRQGTRVTGEAATADITSLTIKREESPSNISVKRLGTGLADFQISWLGFSPLYEIFLSVPALNATESLGFTIQSYYIASVATLINKSYQYPISIEFLITGNGMLNEAFILSSTATGSSLAIVDYPLIWNVQLVSEIMVIWMSWNQSISVEPSNGYAINITCERLCDSFISIQRLFYTDEPSILLDDLFPAISCNISIIGLYGEDEAVLAKEFQSTLPASPVLPPQNIEILAVTAESIEIAWEEVPCSGQNGPIKGYIVHFGAILPFSNERTVIVNDSNITIIVLNDLVPYTKYSISITPYNEHGRGNGSGQLMQRTEEAEPDKVTNINSVRNATSVIITWSEPSINRGIITEYDIRYRWHNISDEYIYVSSVYDTKYKITGLRKSTVYIIEIRANTIKGPGEWNEIKVVLLQGIENVSITAVDDAIFLTWQSASNPDMNEQPNMIAISFSYNFENYTFETKLPFSSTSLKLPLIQDTYRFTIFGVYLIDGELYEGEKTSVIYNIPQTMVNCSGSIDVASEGLNPRTNNAVSKSLIAVMSVQSVLLVVAFIITAVLVVLLWKRKKLTKSLSDSFELQKQLNPKRDTYVEMNMSQPAYQNLPISSDETENSSMSAEKEIEEKRPEEIKFQETSGVYEAIL